MKILYAALLAALVASCASPPPPPVRVVQPKPVPRPAQSVPVAPVDDIDRSYSARGQSSRVKFIILHYTVTNLPLSLKVLTQQEVSSHYLVTDEPVPRVYALVDESRQSNHAGVSNWKNYTLLNGSSIGIEIVHPGYTDGPAGRVWHPFQQAQIDRLIVLVRDIMARHQIPPENILGHADIAPTRKQDPGPMFPWYQLANQGLVVWPDPARVAAARAVYDLQLPAVTWFQQRLAAHGYVLPQTGVLDPVTRSTLTAFQMKYRPVLFDGMPDAETASLLEALAPTPVVNTLPVARPQPQSQPVAPAPRVYYPTPVPSTSTMPSPVTPPMPMTPPAPASTAPVTPVPAPAPAAVPVPVQPQAAPPASAPPSSPTMAPLFRPAAPTPAPAAPAAATPSVNAPATPAQVPAPAVTSPAQPPITAPALAPAQPATPPATPQPSEQEQMQPATQPPATSTVPAPVTSPGTSAVSSPVR